jgi:hypothetical protein
MLLGIYLIPVIGVCTMLLADSFTRDTVDPIKMLALGIMSTIMFFISLEPNSIYIGTFPNGEPGIILSQNLTIAQGILTLLICAVFAYYPPQMHRAAPDSMKKYTRLAILSGFMFSVVVPGSVFLRVSNYIPRLETYLAVLAMIPWTIALVKEPRLAFVLPFKVMRLIIFETEGGLPIYTKNWNGSESRDLKEETLFSSMLQGIGMILGEAVKKGAIREIQLTDAILLLHRSEKYPIACVLVATKSTKTLRHALNNFAEEFYITFSDKFDILSEPRRFDAADLLVEQHFAFVPE